MLFKRICSVLFCLFFLHLNAEAPKSLKNLGEKKEVVQKALQRYLPIKGDSEAYIGYLPITEKEGINRATWVYVKKALDHFREKAPLFILLHLDTPGGELFACEQISEELKQMSRAEGIPVVAYVDNWALSGGALIALSCPFIYTSESAIMGAATPVVRDAQGEMKKASEKMISVLRADFASTAQFYYRSPLLAQAMVDESLILVLREGKIEKLHSEEDILDSDTIISPEGKLLTLTSQEMQAYGMSEGIVPMTKRFKPELNQSSWSFEKEPLAKVPYFSKLKKAVVHTYESDWKVSLIVFLAHPLVASLLLFGVFAAGYFEWQTPGFGLAGTVAIICLFLLGVGGASLDSLSWLEISIVLLGAVLLLIEIFVIPGFGVVGGLGIAFLVIGVLLLFLPSLQEIHFDFKTGNINAAGGLVLERLSWLMGTLLFTALVLASLSRYIKLNKGLRSHLISYGEQEGYKASGEEIPHDLIGELALTATVLRPSGKIILKGVIYEAQSEGTFIEKDEKVSIVDIRGRTLLVRRA